MNSSYSGISCQLQKSSTKRPGSSGTAGHDGPRARLGEVPLDAALDERDLLRREGAAHADGAVAAKRFCDLRPDARTQSASSIRSQ